MIAADVDDEALVVPGGIKRNDRIAYKSAVNYNGRYDQCKVGPRLPPPNPLSAWGCHCTRAMLSSLALGVSSKNTSRSPPFLLRPSSVLVAPSARHSGSERRKTYTLGHLELPGTLFVRGLPHRLNAMQRAIRRLGQWGSPVSFHVHFSARTYLNPREA